MIKVTRFNRTGKLWVNEDLIEFIEETPDTILSMTTGRKLTVAENADEVVALIEAVRKRFLVAERTDYELCRRHAEITPVEYETCGGLPVTVRNETASPLNEGQTGKAVCPEKYSE